jgi:predicted metal-binding membrane protein
MVLSVPDQLALTERMVRKERTIILGAIALLAGLAWLWTMTGAGMPMGEGGMAGMPRSAPPPLLLTLAMWWVMMAAMMLPSAAPVILLYGRVRRDRGGQSTIAASGVFLSGYLLAWLGMSALAAALQIWAIRAGLLNGVTMRSSHASLAGATLIAAGLYQLLPMKNACLTNCRSPAAFLSRHWRPGVGGALRLGLMHGGYCIGCCWLLMALLFVGGVMNFVWIAALTALVTAEKLLPGSGLISRGAGLALIVWGLARTLI